jgi:hypothetical protein
LASPTLLRQSASVTASTTNSITVPMPAGVAEGELLFLAWGFYAPATSSSSPVYTSAPSGWNDILEGSPNEGRSLYHNGAPWIPSSGSPSDGGHGRVWWKIAGPSEPSVTITYFGGYDTGADCCHAGVIFNYSKGARVTKSGVLSDNNQAANRPFAAWTHPSPGTELTVVHFGIMQDNLSLGTATGWTAGTALTTATGQDFGFKTFTKTEVTGNTTADATTAAAVVAPREYWFIGVGIGWSSLASTAPTRRIMHRLVR